MLFLSSLGFYDSGDSNTICYLHSSSVKYLKCLIVHDLIPFAIPVCTLLIVAFVHLNLNTRQSYNAIESSAVVPDCTADGSIKSVLPVEQYSSLKTKRFLLHTSFR